MSPGRSCPPSHGSCLVSTPWFAAEAGAYASGGDRSAQTSFETDRGFSSLLRHRWGQAGLTRSGSDSAGVGKAGRSCLSAQCIIRQDGGQSGVPEGTTPREYPGCPLSPVSVGKGDGLGGGKWPEGLSYGYDRRFMARDTTWPCPSTRSRREGRRLRRSPAGSQRAPRGSPKPAAGYPGLRPTRGSPERAAAA